MGVAAIDLWDFDVISTENLGTQGWAADTVGEHKTDELARIIRNLNPECRVLPYPRKWHPDAYPKGESDGLSAMFVCVDCLETRQAIVAQGTDPKSVFPFPVIDTRMGALAMRVVVPRTAKDYTDSLPRPEQVHQAPCTERATFFCASICAGLAVSVWVSLLRGQEPVYRDFMLLLPALEISAAEPFTEPTPDVEA